MASKNLNRRNYVNRRFAEETSMNRLSRKEKRKILKRLWAEARVKYP